MASTEENASPSPSESGDPRGDDDLQSKASTEENASPSPSESGDPRGNDALQNTASLEELQTDTQRLVLDAVTQIRKCGLDGILELPQLVVCGDQSAGKSSVLEALTEIPFPRNDNLCTRFATEISLRRANTETLTIKVIPDEKRSPQEKASIEKFKQVINNFDDLPRVMDLAMETMGIKKSGSVETTQAFARDVLSIVIEGPTRPQLTLVDIPGLIATHTKGTTSADVDTVAQITEKYITQRRTICLAVVSATSDYANQKILEKVRKVDPKGERTLGIITKPDRLEAGSGSETAFIELANNMDVFFQLGWHVLKNRSFNEQEFELKDRNTAEEAFFRSSNWKNLAPGSRGIGSLRVRLARLLFHHVKKELPKLKKDLEDLLKSNRQKLDLLGDQRSTVVDCKSYLVDRSTEYREICKAAVDGNYQARYFYSNVDHLRRIRAVVQKLNMSFTDELRKRGHKFHIDLSDDTSPTIDKSQVSSAILADVDKNDPPKALTMKEALQWAYEAMSLTRGKELLGNYNPLLIADLFRMQSWKWEDLAQAHLEKIDDICITFLRTLLYEKCPEDVAERIWGSVFEERLTARSKAALGGLRVLIKELRDPPINYNHYYTDTIDKCRQARQKAAITRMITAATTERFIRDEEDDVVERIKQFDIAKAINYSSNQDPDMDNVSCREALDCLLAIYKVQQKVFVANVPTQVIERHIMNDLENIFSASVVNGLTDAEVLSIAGEPDDITNQRKNLEDQISRLEKGQEVFRSIMRGSR